MPDFDLDAALTPPVGDEYIQCRECGSEQIRLSSTEITQDGYYCTLHMLCDACGSGSHQELVWKHGEDGANRRVGTSGPAEETDCYNCHTPGSFEVEGMPELRHMPRENDDPQRLAVTRLASCLRCAYGFWDIYQPEGSKYVGYPGR